MINEEIADIFEKMSRVLAFKGANRFRALAEQRATPQRGDDLLLDFSSRSRRLHRDFVEYSPDANQVFERGLGSLLLMRPFNLAFQCDYTFINCDDDLIGWNPDIAFERVQRGFDDVCVCRLGERANYQVVRYCATSQRWPTLSRRR
jgi:hypothetical protein